MKKKRKWKKIIGFVGSIGSGKSTAAQMLEEYGYEVKSFARPVKEVAAVLFNPKGNSIDRKWKDSPLKEVTISELTLVKDDLYAFRDVPLTGRRVLNKIADGLKREFGEDIFTDILFREDFSHIVIDDVRHPREVEAIESRGGVVFRISRETAKGYSWEHSSELSLNGHIFPTIYNDGTKKQLRENIKSIL